VLYFSCVPCLAPLLVPHPFPTRRSSDLDVAGFPEEGAPDSQVVLHSRYRPLLGGAPRRLERGERRRRPVVAAIRGEYGTRLLNSREPPFLLEDVPRGRFPVGELERKRPSPKRHSAFVFLGYSVQSH